jgi:hypothetical protein
VIAAIALIASSESFLRKYFDRFPLRRRRIEDDKKADDNAPKKQEDKLTKNATENVDLFTIIVLRANTRIVYSG